MTLYVVTTEAVDGFDLSNPFVNTFTYDIPDFGPDQLGAQSLAEMFIDLVIDNEDGIASVLHPSTVFNRITVQTPADDSILWVQALNIPGTRTGTAMPRFVAWGFKQERGRGDMRAGFKRFSRITETDTSGDQPHPNAVILLNNLATRMSTGIFVETSLGQGFAIPIIVKRIKYVTEGGAEAYRFPNATDPYIFYQATTWAFQKITTQNSRKS